MNSVSIHGDLCWTAHPQSRDLLGYAAPGFDNVSLINLFAVD